MEYRNSLGQKPVCFYDPLTGQHEITGETENVYIHEYVNDKGKKVCNCQVLKSTLHKLADKGCIIIYWR